MNNAGLTTNISLKQSKIDVLNTLEICNLYLCCILNKKDINDTRNALVRYFVPSVGGPIPTAQKRRPLTFHEVEQAFEFLKTVSLEDLAISPDLALKTLEELDSSPSQRERVRANLRFLVDWAREQHYLTAPHNPIPKGICADIKIGQYKKLRLKPVNTLQIFEKYLEQVEDPEVIDDLKNAIVRFFIPGCDGPLPLHKPASDFEIKAAYKYLENIPLEYLNEAVSIANAVLDAFGSSQTHGTRIRNALRNLIKWARAEQYLPEPNSIAPWGEEYVSPEVLNAEAVTKEKQQTLWDSYEEYLEYLKQSNKKRQIDLLQTLIIRYFIPACGGPAPTDAKATIEEIQTGLSFLQENSANVLSNAMTLIEAEFERLNLPTTKRYSLRSRLRAWLNWLANQGYDCIAEQKKQKPKPVFNRFYTYGVRRKYKKLGIKMHENRCPTHALCAKQFPGDYINLNLQQQLNAYEKWRLSKDVRPGSIQTEKEQILQLLGWLHRYEEVPLDELCFERMIAECKLVFLVKDYKKFEGYLMEKEKGIQEARAQADRDKQRVQRYLKFVGTHQRTQARRLFIVLSIAKFLYRDLLGSDEYPENRDIPVLRRLLDLQAEIKKKSKSTLQTISYSEASVPWEEAVKAMEKQRELAEFVNTYARNQKKREGYIVRRRPDTALANELQRFLSIAFCIFVPSRSRTFYDLRIGETFKEGVLQNTRFTPVQELKDRGSWEQYKGKLRFYIHHIAEDYKTGKSITPALLESEGWWVEIPNTLFGNISFYDYIRRWLDWGRAVQGEVNHNFFFRACFSTKPLKTGDWNHRIKTIFEREAGVPVPPKNIRKMFAVQFPEFKESASLLLQHSENMHSSNYDMRQTVKKMEPVMEANEDFIKSTLDKRV